MRSAASVPGPADATGGDDPVPPDEHDRAATDPATSTTAITGTHLDTDG